MKRIIRVSIVIVLLICSVSLSFANGKNEDVTQSFAVPPGADAGVLFLEPYQYEIKIGKKETAMFPSEYGILVVPENYEDPESRLVTIPVLRIFSLGKEKNEPVFHLSGGPGSSNMFFSELNGIIDNHDIVLVGYRGVDGMVSLDLPEAAKAWKGKGADLFSNTSLNYISNAFAVAAKRLEGEGIDLQGYTIQGVAEDLESARKALGYDRIHLLSQSYGTRIAQYYAHLHPDNLLRSAMISVNPPGHFIWDPVMVDNQIRHDAMLLAADPKWSKKTPDLTETVRNVACNMPKRWFGIPIDSGKVKFMAHFMLFHRGTAAVIYDAFIAAEKGDNSGLAVLSIAYDFMMPNVLNWGDWASKGGVDYPEDIDYVGAMIPAGSILGAPASIAGSVALNWPITELPKELKSAQPSHVDTLLIGGNIDFSTPYEYARDELLPVLSNGKQVVLSEFGHTNDIWNFQYEATVNLLSKYFYSGEVDDSLFEYQPMVFEPGMNLRLTAKVALGFVFVLLIGVIALILGHIRRLKRKEEI